jgi:hypothetical protein
MSKKSMKTILSIYATVIGCAWVALSADATVRYVNVNNTNPSPPYTNLATAANVIQHAIDVASAGDEIVVTNGVYQSGGAIVSGLSNRVAVTKALTLRSVNGPLVTIIRGEPAANPARCVYLTNGAQLVGFTLTGGSTSSAEKDEFQKTAGGGAWCNSQDAVLLNCILTGNEAATGGGVSSGTLYNCKLINNRAWGTGFDAGFGGGAAGAVLNNCLLQSNSSNFGGGAAGSTLNNCTVIENFAWFEFIPDGRGSGAYGSTLYNCAVYFNNDPVTSEPSNYSECLINYSCITPRPADGIGNITNAPLFVDAATGDFRLQSNSPCINAGRNANAPGEFDLDGNGRIVGRTVDIGAYEFQLPQSAISYAWLRQYGLPTDGSTDLLDPDSDGHNNWQEWRAGTDPLDADSLLRLLAPLVSSNGVVVRWHGVTNRTYRVERSGDLTQGQFGPIATNIISQPGLTAWAHTNAPVAQPFFYRVRVEE